MRRIRNRNNKPRGWPDDEIKTLVEEACGKWTGTSRRHEFWPSGSTCYLCFGDREHFSHWLPKEVQAVFDKRVKESEDLFRINVRTA